MASPKTISFGKKYAPDETKPKVVRVEDIFGEAFDIVEDVNIFQALLVGEGDEVKGSELAKMLVNLVADHDKARFRNLLARQRNLTGERFGELFQDLVEVASGGRPTAASSGSSRGTRAKTAGALSAAS